MIILNGELFQTLTGRTKENDGNFFVFVEGHIKGKEERDRFDKAIKHEIITIDIPEDFIFVTTTSDHGSIDYIEGVEDENTDYKVIYTFQETKSRKVNKDDIFASILAENIKNKVNILAIKELLLEKNIITEEEYDEKIRNLYSENIKKFTYEFKKNI